MIVDTNTILCVGAATLTTSLALVVILSRRGSQSALLPPSPPSDPIIGHARYIPLEYSWETFSAWRKSFGDIIYINILGRPVVILNSLQTIRDLFEKNGANFSDRPYFLVMNDLLGLGSTTPFLGYGDRWRRQRRIFQRYLDPQSIQSFRPIQQQHVELFLQALLVSPGPFINSMKRFSSLLSLETVYGSCVVSADETLLGKFKKAAALIVEVGDAGGTIIDIIPALRFVPTWLPTWFPGVAVKRHALEAHDLIREIMNTPMEELRAKRAEGMSETCIMSKILDDYEKSNVQNTEMEEDIKALGVVAFTGGYDTTNTVLLTFFLMMTLNPEVGKRAQVGLDELTHGERVVTLDDRSQLPYIDCILKETYRIHPPVPLGLPHQSVHAEMYGKWTIPAGSMVIANMWEMVNDEVNYPNPRSFYPERFLRREGAGELQDRDSAQGNLVDPTDIIFGSGRRICPGRFFADATIWLAVANVLAFFDIGPIVDAGTGKELPPDGLYHSGFTSMPKDFRCSIVPRSVKHAQMIRDLKELAIPI